MRVDWNTSCLGVEDLLRVLKGGKCFKLELDELIQFFVILSGNGTDKFDSCVENYFGGIVIEGVSSFSVVSNTVTN